MLILQFKCLSVETAERRRSGGPEAPWLEEAPEMMPLLKASVQVTGPLGV